MTTKTTTNRGSIPCIAAHQTFQTSDRHLSATSDGSHSEWGNQLPDEWKSQFRAAKHSGAYVVYSYETPIAWWVKETDTWVVPNVRYSVTTSKHQGIARFGATINGEHRPMITEYFNMPLVGGSWHRFLFEENGDVRCMVCGAYYFDEHSSVNSCSQRTDLVHGSDTSSHSLDNCSAFDETGECGHLAAALGCDCDLCA